MGDFGNDVTASVQPKADNQPPEVFCEKHVPKNLANFAGNHLC